MLDLYVFKEFGKSNSELLFVFVFLSVTAEADLSVIYAFLKNLSFAFDEPKGGLGVEAFFFLTFCELYCTILRLSIIFVCTRFRFMSLLYTTSVSVIFYAAGTINWSGLLGRASGDAFSDPEISSLIWSSPKTAVGLRRFASVNGG